MDQKSGKDKKTFFQKFTDALIRLSSGSSSDNDEVELVRQSMQQHEPAAKRPRQQDTQVIEISDDEGEDSDIEFLGETPKLQQQQLDKTKVSILKRPNDFVQDDKKFIELADFVEQSNTANGMMSGADSNISGVTSKRCNLDSLSKIANIGKRIGYGSYGTVYDAKVNGYNKNLALKREYYRKANRAEDMRHEQALLTELSQKYQQNPFILMYFGGCDDIKMKDYDEQTPFVNNRGFGVINNIDSEELSTVRPRDDNNIFYVFSERGSMDLEKYMETNSKTISTYEFLNLALQVLVQTAWYATEFNIVHYDLYFRNVLMFMNNNAAQYDYKSDREKHSFIFNVCGNKFIVDVGKYMCKIIDFGLASRGTEEFLKYRRNKAHMEQSKFLDTHPTDTDHVKDYILPPYCMDVFAVLASFYDSYDDFDLGKRKWLSRAWEYLVADVKQNESKYWQPQAICDFIAHVFGPEFLKQTVPKLGTFDMFVQKD